MELAGRRVLVMGLGRHGGGVGAVRYLVGRGAQVAVTDLLPPEEMHVSLGALSDLPQVELTLGGHRDADFDRAELVVVNPAVRPNDPWLARLAARGVPTTTEIDLFLAACPAQLIGVTGSNGKSTSVAMLAAALGASGRQTWLGGNLGGSLLDSVDRMVTEDWVVLELSSFQMHRLARGPGRFRAAVVTNCTPNHLDWHPDFARYAAAKRRLLELLAPQGVAVLNPRDPESWSWRASLSGRATMAAWDEREFPPLLIPGGHNRVNAALAAAAAIAVGCPREAVAKSISDFTGLPHRLEMVAEIDGRRFYDDSKSTTPEATAAAVRALAESGPAWVLVGGADKRVDLTPAAEAISSQAQGAAVYGSVREPLAVLIRQQNHRMPIHVVETLGQALDWCWQSSQPGDAILLSPGCASFDQFRDYVHRAAVFREHVARKLSPALVPGERGA